MFGIVVVTGANRNTYFLNTNDFLIATEINTACLRQPTRKKPTMTSTQIEGKLNREQKQPKQEGVAIPSASTRVCPV